MVIYLFHMLCFLANFFHIFPHLLFIFVLLFPQKLRIYNYINTKKEEVRLFPSYQSIEIFYFLDFKIF